MNSLPEKIRAIIPEDPIAQAQIIERFGKKVRIKNLENKYKTYNDKNEEISQQIINAAADFSDNPRSLKRFINQFRLQYFLWSARCDAQDKEIFPLDILRRWVVFTMKWPQVLGWIQHSEIHECIGTKNSGKTEFSNRLQQLEVIGKGAEDMEIWRQNAKEIAQLDISKAPWLEDDSIRQFFYEESKLPQRNRLSEFVGKGLL